MSHTHTHTHTIDLNWFLSAHLVISVDEGVGGLKGKMNSRPLISTEKLQIQSRSFVAVEHSGIELLTTKLCPCILEELGELCLAGRIQQNPVGNAIALDGRLTNVAGIWLGVHIPVVRHLSVNNYCKSET